MLIENVAVQSDAIGEAEISGIAPAGKDFGSDVEKGMRSSIQTGLPF